MGEPDIREGTTVDSLQQGLAERAGGKDTARVVFDTAFRAALYGDGESGDIADRIFLDCIRDDWARRQEYLVHHPTCDSLFQTVIQTLGARCAASYQDTEIIDRWRRYIEVHQTILHTRIESGEIDEETARLFLAHLISPDFGDGFYDSMIARPGYFSPGAEEARATAQGKEEYQQAIDRLVALYPREKVRRGSSFTAFFETNERADPMMRRLYITIDPHNNPAAAIDAFAHVLEGMGLKGSFQFKIRALGKEADSIVCYFRQEDNMRELQAFVETFARNCPPASLADYHVATAIPIGRGISVAPNPNGTHLLRKALGYGGCSWTEYVAGAVQAAFERAYADKVKQDVEVKSSMELQDAALEYFKQIVAIDLFH